MEELPKFKFEDLQVYQKSLDFVDLAYDISRKFPNTELYNLTSQFKRAAVSVSLNIAEGAGDTNPQFRRFLQIASDSIKECVVCSTIANRQKFISDEENLENRKKLAELSKMISGLQNYLRKNNTRD